MPTPAYTFHPYEHHPSHPSSPLPSTHTPSTHTSSKRSTRLNLTAPFPTFLYASEPPPVTARNKQRVRPNAEQLKALKELYAVSAHPPREVRETLGARIGMRYQSVTNWFQNQRSTAKRRTAEIPITTSPHVHEHHRSSSRSSFTTASTRAYSPDDNDHDMYSPSPPPQPQPIRRRDPVKDIIVAQAAARQQLHELALPLSGAAIVPAASYPNPHHTHSGPSSPDTPTTTLAIALPSSTSRATTPALLSSFQVSRASSPCSITNPHTTTHIELPIPAHNPNVHPAHQQRFTDAVMLDQLPRGKRSRPTPKQLVALRALHARTESPTIEERILLGNEIGMELGKVTNWFRNLRQTARKKERKALEAEGKTLPPARRGNHSSSRRERDSDDDEREEREERVKRRRVERDEESEYGHEERFHSDNDHERNEDEHYDRHESAYTYSPRPHSQSQSRRSYSPHPHHPPYHPQFAHSPPPQQGRYEHSEQGNDDEHDHSRPSSSPLSESDTHEAVTPPMPTHPLPIPVPSKSIEVEVSKAQDREDMVKEGEKKGKDEEGEPSANVNDALLLLALHSAQ